MRPHRFFTQAGAKALKAPHTRRAGPLFLLRQVLLPGLLPLPVHQQQANFSGGPQGAGRRKQQLLPAECLLPTMQAQGATAVHLGCGLARHARSLLRRHAAAAFGPAAVCATSGGSSRSMATKAKKKTGSDKVTYNVATAIAMVQADVRANPRNFAQSFEIALVLGIDPRKPNQTVRGAVTLPHGTGKEVRVAVFARGAEAEAAKEAGAVRVGAEDLLEDIQAGKIEFERLIATPEMMPLVGKVARVLGPRGLMPNPKLGTITKDTAPAVRAAKGGQVQYRAYKDGQVLAGLGKTDFPHAALMDNVRAFMMAIGAAKPEGAKGKYMRQAYFASTMGGGVPVTVATLDPSNARFMHVSADDRAALSSLQEAEAAAAAAQQAVAAAVAEGGGAQAAASAA